MVVAGILEAHISSHERCRGALQEGSLLIKIVLREKETIQEWVRRFRKLFERSGLKRELRRRERYEKPSDVKRKAKDRAIRRSKKQLQVR